MCVEYFILFIIDGRLTVVKDYNLKSVEYSFIKEIFGF